MLSSEVGLKTGAMTPIVVIPVEHSGYRTHMVGRQTKVYNE